MHLVIEHFKVCGCRRFRIYQILLLAIGFMTFPIACSEASEDVVSTPLRIVSFSPALTRTLEDLGLSESIVGCTPFCRPHQQDAAVVGDLREINYEILARLQPTHILVQATTSGIQPKLQALAETRGWQIGVWPTDDLQDIRTLLAELPELLGGTGQSQSNTLLAAIDEIGTKRRSWSGRTLVVTGGQPLLGFGPQTYMGELLDRFGVPNALESGDWMNLSLEDVVRLRPQAIIVIGSQEGQAAATIRALARDEVFAAPVVVLDHPEALVPSSRVIEVSVALANLIDELGSKNEQTSMSYE